MKIFEGNEHLESWDEFVKAYPTKEFAKGEMILMQGEVPTDIHIIKSGFVKAYSIDQDGEEHPISFDMSGEVFPIGWALNLIDSTQYLYKALTDCEVYMVPKEDFAIHIKDNPKIGYEFYEALARWVLGLQARIHALSQKLSRDKIILTLIYLAECFGTDVENSAKAKKRRIVIPLTHQELSSFVGLTRETMSIELKKLEKLGAISYKNRIYTADLSKLKELSNQE